MREINDDALGGGWPFAILVVLIMMWPFLLFIYIAITEQ
jgi:hypothetical protein